MDQVNQPLSSLQGLRALAALAVFMFHLVPYVEVAGAGLFPEQVYRWGYAGVDIFFVLSGFVLTLSAASGRGHQVAIKFYTLRIWRIYSGYWPFLILMYLANLFFGFERAADDSILGSIFLIDIRLEKLVLAVSWTLTYELYFYALFCLLFLIPPARSRVAALVYTGAIVAFTAIYSDSADSLVLGFIFSPYVLEFFFGVLLAKYWLRGAIEIPKPLLWFTFMASFYAGSILFNVAPEDELGRSITFGIGSGALILAVASNNLLEGRRLGRGLAGLGNASYTLYLCHLIFIDTAHELGLFAYLGQQDQALANLGILTFIVTVCLFSTTFYRLYEKPTYLWLKSRMREQRKIILGRDDRT